MRAIVSPSRTVRALARVAPPLAARFAWRRYPLTRPTVPLRAQEHDISASAVRADLDVRGTRVTTYTWGSGERAVLLVHGWRSRASRFGPLIRRLVADGYRVVGFDAPGNGESDGETSSIFDYLDAVKLLARREREFDAIVTHSFGTLAAFIGTREGVLAHSIVPIAGVHDFDFVLTAYRHRVGLPPTVSLRRQVERAYLPSEPDPWGRFVARVDASVPLLVVHDEQDHRAPIEQARLTVAAHEGRVEFEVTDGLGHNRILSDEGVADRIARFIAGVTDSVVSRGSSSTR